MEDVTRLVLQVDSKGVANATVNLNLLTKAGKQTEKATDGVAAGFKRLLGPLLALVSVSAGIKKLVGTSREFDVLNASLKTATGSAEGATAAFEAIQDFATNTPYALTDVTEAFVKLVNYGLTPSERALTSYGNTSAALGKDLSQMIEAVADAATFEFERLKEFGIKARQEGDNVSFTFRGVTTTVKKNAAEIENYLIGLGENNFAGAMAERMNTLDGALSNLGDEWDKLWLNISQAGSGDVIEDIVRGAIDALAELNAMLASGQLQGYIEAVIGKFDGWVEAVESTLGIIQDLLDAAFPQWANSGQSAIGWLIDAFVQFPENVKAVMGLVGVEIWSLVDYATATGKAMWEVFVGTFRFILDSATSFGKAIGNALNPFSDAGFKDTLVQGMGEAIEALATKATAAFEELDTRAEIRRQAREETIDGILAEREAALNSFDDQIEAADALRQKFDELKAAREAANEGRDRLEPFKFDAGDAGATDFSTPLSSRDKEVEKIRQALLTEEEAIQESYDKRREIILASTLTTEEEKNQILQRLDNEYRDQMRQAEIQRWKTALSAYDDFQNNLLVLARTGNKKFAAIYKAAAIANTIVKTYESATSAYSAMASIPYVGPVLGAAAAAAAIAAGLANVQAIKNQQVGGYATGGILGGNQPSGDVLNYQGNSGEVVLNFSQQKKLLAMADGKATPAASQGQMIQPVVNVYPLPGETAEVTTNDQGELEVYIRKAKEAVAGDLLSGTGVVNRGFDAALARKGVA